MLWNPAAIQSQVRCPEYSTPCASFPTSESSSHHKFLEAEMSWWLPAAHIGSTLNARSPHRTKLALTQNSQEGQNISNHVFNLNTFNER